MRSGEPAGGFLEYFRAASIATIAEVGGDVWGGACELVLSCDLIVATADTGMAVTRRKLGVGYPPPGLPDSSPVCRPQVVARMFLTAEPITMQTAFETQRDHAEIVEAGERLWSPQRALEAGSGQDRPKCAARRSRPRKRLAGQTIRRASAAGGCQSRSGETVARAWASQDLAGDQGLQQAASPRLSRRRASPPATGVFWSPVDARGHR